MADKSSDENFKTEWQDLLCSNYDAKEAQSCIDTMDAQSCSDWADNDWQTECNNVYGC